MKTIILALLISLIVHVIYFIVTIILGILKTKKFMSSGHHDFNQIVTDKKHVTFGKKTSPFIFLLTFFGLTLLIVFLI